MDEALNSGVIPGYRNSTKQSDWSCSKSSVKEDRQSRKGPALAGLLILVVCIGSADTLGRPTKRTLPGGQSESFTYDVVGNVATHVTFNGETIAYQYDAMNRLAAKTLPGGNTVSYTYTATGQVATVADARGLTKYTYDERDRVTKVEHPEGGVVSYTYDPAGNRASMTTQWGSEAAKTTLYEYDAANRHNKRANCDRLRVGAI